jgi:hypothetical protein
MKAKTLDEGSLLLRAFSNKVFEDLLACEKILNGNQHSGEVR